ncbi:ABC transporter permease [Gorillibacterium sp. CAU 1737]|uniref:ABC transporter permease n=1 Tax=Gorillibacterium sp. CAU 1737 TaxID=3140362 RepID=UPI003260CF28
MIIHESMLRKVDSVAQQSDQLVREPISYWQDAWRRLRRNPVAMASLVVLFLILCFALFGPMIRGADYITIAAKYKNTKPNGTFWFGTDSLGRDLFSRVAIGTRISVSVALVASFIQIVVGSVYGGVMAYFGGVVDEIMMRIIEVLNSIPSLIITILIMILLGNGMIPLLIALCIASWTGTARMIRGQVMQLRESEYVLAAQTLGASHARVIGKHLLPNTLGLLILNASTSIPAVIFDETVLSFLGIGIQPPKFSLGTLISLGQDMMSFYPYQLLFPAGILCLMVLAFNLFGEGLRDALDPKLRK